MAGFSTATESYPSKAGIYPEIATGQGRNNFKSPPANQGNRGRARNRGVYPAVQVTIYNPKTGEVKQVSFGEAEEYWIPRGWVKGAPPARPVSGGLYPGGPYPGSAIPEDRYGNSAGPISARPVMSMPEQGSTDDAYAAIKARAGGEQTPPANQFIFTPAGGQTAPASSPQTAPATATPYSGKSAFAAMAGNIPQQQGFRMEPTGGNWMGGGGGYRITLPGADEVAGGSVRNAAGEQILGMLKRMTTTGQMPPGVKELIGGLSPDQAAAALASLVSYNEDQKTKADIQSRVNDALKVRMEGDEDFRKRMEGMIGEVDRRLEESIAEGKSVKELAEEHRKRVEESADRAVGRVEEWARDSYERAMRSGEASVTEAKRMMADVEAKYKNLTAEMVEARYDAVVADTAATVKRLRSLGTPEALAEATRIEQKGRAAVQQAASEARTLYNNKVAEIGTTAAGLVSTLRQATQAVGGQVMVTGLSSLADILDRTEMYKAFAGQLGVQTAMEVAQMNQAARFNATQMKIGIGQLLDSGMKDFADFILNLPVVNDSSTSTLISMLGRLLSEAQTDRELKAATAAMSRPSFSFGFNPAPPGRYNVMG